MKSLVFFPSERTAPREVIQHLREIDPTFELAWVGSAWLLGRVRPSERRYLAGGRMLRRELAAPEPERGVIAYARLAMQGFAATEAYEHEADSRIVDDARIRIHNLHHRPEATFAERLDETLGGPSRREKQAQVRRGVEAVSSDAWRRAFKRPVYSRPYRASFHS